MYSTISEFKHKAAQNKYLPKLQKTIPKNLSSIINATKKDFDVTVEVVKDVKNKIV
jgi:hypothetical protein